MDWYEVEELACLMLNKDYDTVIEKGEDIDWDFSDKYNITLDDFYNLLKDLIKFTSSWKSPLTNTLYQGFVVSEGKGLMKAIIKEEVR